jgi:outer membrane protein OmpA-like peptidoglycan-associated protein/peptidyl-tRNA hydrolase
MNKFTIFLWLTVCLCAQAQTAGKHGVKNPQGSGYADIAAVAQDQQRLVLYRSPTAKQVGVVALYINDRYHTSLQHNTFTVLCFDPRITQLRARMHLSMGHAQLDLDAEQELPAKPSGSMYVRVSEHSDGRPRLDLVSAQTAFPELQTTQQQMHVLSRVAQKRECKENMTRQALVTSVTTLTLSADIWFASRKTDLRAITPDSRRELDALIQKIDNEYKKASSVRVLLTGHADDTEDHYQNEQLAKMRAQAISLYLLSNGLPPDSVTVEWSAAYNQTHSQDGYHNRRAELGVFINLN